MPFQNSSKTLLEELEKFFGMDTINKITYKKTPLAGTRFFEASAVQAKMLEVLLGVSSC
jgi:hypothetical protein